MSGFFDTISDSQTTYITPDNWTKQTLLFGDCFELLPTLPKKSIDMILTDPPYGVTSCQWDLEIPLLRWTFLDNKRLYEKEYLFQMMKRGINYNSAVESFKKTAKPGLWDLLIPLLKNNGIVVITSIQPFTISLINSNLKMFKYLWIWEKPQGVDPFMASKRPLNNIEEILVFYKNQPKYNPQKLPGAPYHIIRDKNPRIMEIKGTKLKQTETKNDGDRFPHRILRFKQERGFHPTQKPTALFEYLIRTYTDSGDTVLDPFMGSGTTGVACKRINREFIGIEKQKDYFEIAEKRILGSI